MKKPRIEAYLAQSETKHCNDNIWDVEISLKKIRNGWKNEYSSVTVQTKHLI